MDAVTRTRSCCRTRTHENPECIPGDRQICLNIDRQTYDRIWGDPRAVRAWVDAERARHPELFPAAMSRYQLHGRSAESRKLPGIQLRQVRLPDGSVYMLRPSFVMSYMTGYADDVEYPLQLLAFGLPSWLVAVGFGHSAQFWDRHLERLGRLSVVGTTTRASGEVPLHLTVDEHQVPWSGAKGHVPMVAGNGCILGISLTDTPSDTSLTQAYGQFAQEAAKVDPHYAPHTVNTDGWLSTQHAWSTLYPLVVLIRCFLHGFLKIRERCNKNYALHERVWHVFYAETKADFIARMTELGQWTASQSLPATVIESLKKLRNRTDEYAVAYDHPQCRRTSNMVDRLMNRLYRVLYAHRGLHGHLESSERRLRGWALLLNFCPFAPRAGQPREHTSPAHRLNGKQYHTRWLQNLLLSGSLGGRASRT